MTATLPNIQAYLALGIDPVTKLPIKMGKGVEGTDINLKNDILRFLRLIDEQDAVNRYVWRNLPGTLSSQDLERLLYYKGQLALFFEKTTGEFYFMPFAMEGGLDFYGRFAGIHPIPVNQRTANKKEMSALEKYLGEIKLKPVYSIVDPDKMTMEDYMKSAVILKDYTPQLSETIIPRQIVNDTLLEAMAECVPLMRTHLYCHTGVKGMRVNDQDQADSVVGANLQMKKFALTGNPFTPIVGTTEFQDLAGGDASGKTDEYMIAMRALDNLRLSGYGIDNGGLFEKKAHTLEGEIQTNNASVGIVYQDGLSLRQNFANIANSIWGTAIWCDANEDIINQDIDGDGLSYYNNYGDGSGNGGGESNGNDNTQVQD